MLQLLIVDDNKVARDGIKHIIESRLMQHFLAYEAENGYEALDIVSTEAIDILITDIKMPHMNGLELSDRALERRPNLKVIILSAYGEFEYAKKGIELGVKHYLLKPVNVQELANTLFKLAKLEEIQDAGTDVTAKENSSGSNAVDTVIHIIQKRYREDLSLEQLAEEVYLNPSYLSHLFKKQVGMGLMKYITLTRMERAKELLTQTNLKIVDICNYVGYKNSTYFCTFFKQWSGKTPLQYREDH